MACGQERNHPPTNTATVRNGSAPFSTNGIKTPHKPPPRTRSIDCPTRSSYVFSNRVLLILLRTKQGIALAGCWQLSYESVKIRRRAPSLERNTLSNFFGSFALLLPCLKPPPLFLLSFGEQPPVKQVLGNDRKKDVGCQYGDDGDPTCFGY